MCSFKTWLQMLRLSTKENENSSRCYREKLWRFTNRTTFFSRTDGPSWNLCIPRHSTMDNATGILKERRYFQGVHLATDHSMINVRNLCNDYGSSILYEPQEEVSYERNVYPTFFFRNPKIKNKETLFL